MVHPKLFRHAAHIAGIQSGVLLPPVMVDIDPVDGICNLDCEWCCQAASRASRETRFMSVPTMQRMSPFTKGWGVKAWRIAGDSEPLLNKEIGVLLESGHTAGIEVGLVTNGVFLDRLTAADLRALTFLGVSLDAATAPTWAALKRADPKDFQRILEGVRRARALAPQLDISLKMVVWNAAISAHKEDFAKDLQPEAKVPQQQFATNTHEVDALKALASQLGVRALVRESYKANPAHTFTKCFATALGGVFDAHHLFHLCCDAHSRYVLTTDYTRDDWQELPRLWGSPQHLALIQSIVPATCVGGAKHELNAVLQHLVVEPDPAQQVNFI